MLRIAVLFGICIITGSVRAQDAPPQRPDGWPSRGGALAVQKGQDSLQVMCARGETMQRCAEAAGVLMDRFNAFVPSEPAFRPPAVKVAQPIAAPSAPDVTPTIWLRPSRAIDPTRLPLGNKRIVTDAPRKGYIFTCDPFMYSMRTIIGATRTGPWVNEQAMTYDITRKVFDRGRVEWPGRLSVEARGTGRVIRGNGLPLPGVPTGIFPVPTQDPAYQFDPNPNAIAEQTIAFTVPLEPAFGAAPRCLYKEVGITLDGIQIHTGLDSSGRDENGYELNDTCGGKSQPGGGYHRSVLSDCTPHIREPRVVVGYALDGFPITGPYDADGAELTTANLDECHGTTSEIVWDGRKVNAYHYVLTRDFPYSVSCFKGTPTRYAFPPLPGAPPQLR